MNAIKKLCRNYNKLKCSLEVKLKATDGKNYSKCKFCVCELKIRSQLFVCVVVYMRVCVCVCVLPCNIHFHELKSFMKKIIIMVTK